MPNLGNAVRDLRYLLDRGYPRDSAVNFVSNHYRLPLGERHLLARCVFSRREVVKHRRKAVRAGAVRGKRLGVDGYNVLITLESLLTGKQIIRCDDGYIRDLRAIFGKYHTTPATAKAISTLVRMIARAKPKSVAVFFDKQVSRSGELAAEVRQQLGRAGLKGDASAVGGVDMKLRAFDVVASSDRAVIERAKAVWDIPASILKRKRVNLFEIAKH
ncbi:MAG: DUF434 domain-containing protein [Candidatus Hodarchaeaceae archaeon]|nr:DUF434 domain-containing protein [Candidatus Hodarchaeaceae archaeon]